MSKSGKARFWEGGHGEYLKALRNEEMEKIKPIRQALKSETDPEIKRGLKDQIKAIQAEFKQKRKAAESGLFMKT